MEHAIETTALSRGAKAHRKVAVGSTVEIERADGSTEEWRIADHGGSDVEGGVIACDSPLARAVLGARTGETRTFWAGRREWTVLVRRVRADRQR